MRSRGVVKRARVRRRDSGNGGTRSYSSHNGADWKRRRTRVTHPASIEQMLPVVPPTNDQYLGTPRERGPRVGVCCALTEKSCKLPAERIFARPARLTPDIHADTFRGSVAKNRARLPKVVPRRSAPTGTTAGHGPLGRLRYADSDARGAMGRRARRTPMCRQRCA